MLHGRAAEVRNIVDNCQASRFTVVTSAPGLGLSSLLLAGAAPALRRAGFITAVYSDWQGRHFAAQLREAIAAAVRCQTDCSFAAESEPLRDLVARAHQRSGKPLAILLDQFEDYLRCHSGTDISDDFDADLANSIGDRDARFVVGLQTHAIMAFERLSQYVPNLLGYRITLLPLPAETAKAVVLGEAARADMDIEPAAVDQLVASPAVAVTGGVHPLFLKLAAGRLFDAEFNLKSKLARSSTLIANGGVERMILESLDTPIQELGSTQIELLFRWIPLLLSVNGHRIAASEKALIAHAGKWNRFAMTLLPLLVQCGLLRIVETAGVIRYEFGRESMAVVVRDWWQRREAAVVARRRALFRVRSISIAAAAILTAYLTWLFLTWKQL